MNDTFLNYLLEFVFGAGSTLTWYVGLVSSENYTGVNRSADDMSSHAGWEEFDAVVGLRPEWVPGTATGRSISNPSGADHVPTADGTVIGAFLCTDNTVNGTTGQLVGPFLFEEGQSLFDGETFRSFTTVNDRDIGV